MIDEVIRHYIIIKFNTIDHINMQSVEYMINFDIVTNLSLLIVLNTFSDWHR